MGNLAIFVNRLAHGCCVDRTPTANHTVSRPICQPQSSREMATLRRSPRDTTRSHASLCLAWSYASGGQGIRTLNRSSRHLISSQAANHSRTLRMNLGRVGGPLGLPRRRPTGLARATTTQDSRLPLRQCRSASPHRPPTVPRWPDRRFPSHFGSRFEPLPAWSILGHSRPVVKTVATPPSTWRPSAVSTDSRRGHLRLKQPAPKAMGRSTTRRAIPGPSSRLGVSFSGRAARAADAGPACPRSSVLRQN